MAKAAFVLRCLCGLLVALFVASAEVHAQPDAALTVLDPTRQVEPEATAKHAPLPEQYIWTAGDVTAQRADRNKYPWNKPQLRISPHYFRASFEVHSLPQRATLYVAGPRWARAYVNGKLAAEFVSDVDEPINFHVFRADVTGLLHQGGNTVAIEAVRGRGIVSGSGSSVWQQLAYGEVLAARIAAAAPGQDAPALVVSNQHWKSSLDAPDGWQQAGFNDAAWGTVESLGSVEGNADLFQWNADAGMYDWPGYMGMSPWLHTYALQAAAASHVFTAHSQFAHIEALTHANAREPFTVSLGESPAPTDADAPALLLDFGREVAGRILVESACNCQTVLSIAYGESEEEAMNSGVNGGHSGGNYLGVNLLRIPPNGTVRGPKSGFRYVRIRFLRGATATPFRAIRAEGIYYPVTYAGAFESSDPLLNRIWETAAYTAHLCMQDGIWDAPKRDRGLWAGDIDVTGQVISDVFADRFLLEETLQRLYPAASAHQHVNDIPGYSALWVSSLASLYQHSGDKEFLMKEHQALLGVLRLMDAEIDDAGLFANKSHRWLFVDWAPGLYADNAQTRRGTHLEFYRAYRDAASLLRELGDAEDAKRSEQQASRLLSAAREHLADSSDGTYGSTWQLNAMAITSGVAPSQSYATIWSSVLSHVQQATPEAQAVSPYFNDYVLNAMAETGHRKEALTWMRQYWGGMLAEGATSFWESYDLRWPKDNPHLSLQADGTSGYFVSLAHGWSSGPAVWLMEQMLGIRPAAPGFRKVAIRPDLMGLAWAKGQQPTPQGPIKIALEEKLGIQITLDLPDGEDAEVSVPLMRQAAGIFVNGQHVDYVSAENGSRGVVRLAHAGHYVIASN